MGEHTPGPWEVAECYDGNYEITHPGETFEETILIGVIIPACNIKNDVPLIKSAPELLEAAGKIIDYYENEEWLNCLEIEEFKKLKKVVNKVKGADE